MPLAHTLSPLSLSPLFRQEQLPVCSSHLNTSLYTVHIMSDVTYATEEPLVIIPTNVEQYRLIQSGLHYISCHFIGVKMTGKHECYCTSQVW